MARGPKKHLKRLNAPKGWLLSKLGGISTVRPSQGPHKLRESIPLSILLRHRLRYCLWAREVKMILRDKEGNVKVNGKVRRDHAFPVGVMGRNIIYLYVFI
jgi:small subunit ribosomal protein S4e